MTDAVTWSNSPGPPGPPLTLERLRENFRRLTELADRGWYVPSERLMASWDNVPCPCPQCEPVQGADNVTDELVALVRQGDEAGFRALAGCVMPAGEIDECWAGARARLGLPGPVPAHAEGAEGLVRPPRQAPQFYGRSIVEMLQEYYSDETR